MQKCTMHRPLTGDMHRASPGDNMQHTTCNDTQQRRATTTTDMQHRTIYSTAFLHSCTAAARAPQRDRPCRAVRNCSRFSTAQHCAHARPPLCAHIRRGTKCTRKKRRRTSVNARTHAALASARRRGGWPAGRMCRICCAATRCMRCMLHVSCCISPGVACCMLAAALHVAYRLVLQAACRMAYVARGA